MQGETRLTLSVTILVSLVVSVAGAAGTAAWWLYDAKSRIESLEAGEKVTELRLDKLYAALQADRQGQTVSGPINTSSGLKCDDGYAIARISLSSQTWDGSVTCVPIRPDLR